MTAKSSYTVHCARTVKITFVGYNHIIFRDEFSINYLFIGYAYAPQIGHLWILSQMFTLFLFKYFLFH